MLRIILIVTFATAMLVAACDRSTPQPQAETPTPIEPAGDHEGHQNHEGEDDVALKTLMGKLGKDMVSVNEALWIEDFDAMAKAATAIADHPHVGPTDKQRIVKILGADMGKFAARDKRVHDAAASLSGAAKKKDLKTVLSELSSLQTGCVGCHTEFRPRLATQ